MKNNVLQGMAVATKTINLVLLVILIITMVD